jgi:hypothetical protein
MTTMKVQQWNFEDVRKWLKNRNLKQFSHIICDKHKVDGQVLLALTESDIREMIGTDCLGDVKRLSIAVRELQIATPSPYEMLTQMPAANGDGIKPTVYSRLDSVDSTISEDGSHRKRISRHLEPEYHKLFLSYVYMFCVFLLTAFVMVIVHDRVPDMEKYPPLPDIVLDNLPYIPWAFDMCEAAGVVLVIIWSITMFFHKHR